MRALHPTSPAARILTWPLAAAALWSIVATGRAHLTGNRDGMVCLYPHRLRPVYTVAIFTGVLAALVLPALALRQLHWSAVAGFGALVFAWSLAAVALSTTGTIRSTDKHTPKGQRYEITFLAQLPGTRFCALALARVLVEQLPPGSVVTGVARDERTLRAYVRAGAFTPTTGRRVHRVIG